jgi:hypothetical protein
MTRSKCSIGANLATWVASFCSAALVALAMAMSPALAAETDWPAITDPATKAWTRWWWHGNAVTKEDLTAVMEQYAAAGIGGLEITPIYGVRGEEENFIEYLSPQWMDMFEHTLREAERLGMQIDMSTGTGWPFGGPWVEADTACRNLVLESYELSTGESLDRPVRHVQRPMVRAIGRRMQIEDLREPIGANDDLQGMALEQVRFEKPLPLLSLVAYGNDGRIVDLSDRVDDDGKLDWVAPDGEWTLYAVFLGWHGKQVERAGPGGEGDVLDHFRRDALGAYLKKFDDAIGDRDIKSFRAFFNDSYEVDDASGNSDATPAIFAEFQRRRGYDLRDHLPALFNKASADENARVWCDYRETISDLLLDEFTKPWTEWAHGYEAITRNQAHGSPANILDLYAASDIPETEGTDRIQFISAASAAHVTGKPLVSAEACTWLDEHFLGTLAASKRWVDDYFLGGVNHICYHGTCYSPPGDPWPGRLFYASVELQPTNPQWAHFHALNDYVARCQSFLQAGSSDSDVLVYYPIHDEWARRGRTTLPHFNGEARGSSARQVAEELLAAGYGVDFISDRQLERLECVNGKLTVGDAVYRALVVPDCKTMPLTSWVRIWQAIIMSEDAAAVVFAGDVPERVPGMAGRENTLIQGMNKERNQRGFGPLVFPLNEVTTSDGDGVATTLAKAGISPEPFARGDALEFVRRRFEDGVAYFIVNKSNEPFDDWVSLNAKAGGVALFNPLSGESGVAETRTDANGADVRVQLAPGESCIVRTHEGMASGAAFPYTEPGGEAAALAALWKLTFNDGGPKLPAAVKLPELKLWTAIDDADAKNFSGIGRYAIEFAKPAGNAAAWVLDLGEVHESAEVRLNGESLGVVFTAPYRVRIPADKLKAEGNVLEIDVANLMANRIAELDRNGVRWQKFYNVNMAPRRPENRGPGGSFSAAKWEPLPSGLAGPVTLTPVE